MYRLAYDPRIEKDLRPIPKSYRRLILQRLMLLTHDPRPAQVEKLSGRADEYRLRVGDYRVLFTIYRIRHRREAYR